MEKVAGHILKSSDVKLEGQFRLDVSREIPNVANKTNAPSAQPQVSIVENHPEFATVEVTCCCGAKTHIKCQYTNAQSDEQETDQKNNGENENESQ